jgi:NAD(P)H-hydrate epimerase
VLAGHFPEATWILLPHEQGVISEDAVSVIKNNIDRATAILIGPGIGTQETTAGCLTRLLREQNKSRQSNRRIGFLHEETPSENSGQSHLLPSLIIDADGLRILAKIPSWAEILPMNSILTPHPGEMSTLTSLSVDEIQSDRMNLARKYSAQWGHIIVLKGAFTIIASPDGRSTTIPVASAALAHAGTGDVLAGLITGYRAQGLPPYEAAITGAWIHAQAGLLAAEYAKNTASVLASDIIGFIGTAISKCGE